MLRKLILAVHRKGASPDDVLETYSFKFTYVDDKVQSCHIVHGSASGSEKVVEVCRDPRAVSRCALQMMRGTLFLVQTLEPLPGDVEVSMRLMYYNDVTPDDYEPPGFLPGVEPMYNFECDPLSIGIGRLSTPYHSLMLSCKTDSGKVDPTRKSALVNVSADNAQNQTSSGENEISLEDIISMPVLTQETSQQDKTEDASSDECIPSSQTPAASCPNLWTDSSNVNRPGTTPLTPVSSHQAPAVAGPSHHDQQLCNCPCSRNKEEGLLLTCNVCYSWSHATCYGFNNDTGLPRAFVCLDCHYVNRGVCIDSKLLSAQPDQRKEICLYRQALAMCQDMELISPAKLGRELSLEHATIYKLMKLLKSDNIIKKATKGTSRGVNQVMLKSVLGEYFHPTTNLTATMGSNHNTEVEEVTKRIEEMPCTLTTSRMGKRSLSVETKNSPTGETRTPKKTRVSRGSSFLMNRIY